MSRHISRMQSVHEGRRRYVRLIEDSFTVPGPFGEHIGMGLEPLKGTALASRSASRYRGLVAN